MFWKYNNPPPSQIGVILAKEDVNLNELMDEDDVITECKLQNRALVEFLTKPSVIEELVTLTTIEPSCEVDEQIRFKYSNIACEILTSNVSALNEQLASSPMLLSKLCQFLDSEPPLNPLLASFFSKIMGALIAKKTEQNWLSYQVTCLQVLDFIKAKDDFVKNLLKHLGTSAIMDLTLTLLTQIESTEPRNNILSWLDGQEFVQSLLALFAPSIDSDRHFNTAQLLCDFIKTTRDNIRNSKEHNEPNVLLNTLEAPQMISLLLDHMLSEPQTESGIVGGIQVLLALLEPVKNNGGNDDLKELELNQVVVESTTQAVLSRLGDFHALLKDPPKKPAVSTTIGVLNPPLGNTRLQVVRLLTATVSRNNPTFLKELITLGTTHVLLDLFFAFPWNNFLHAQVEAFLNYMLRAQIPSEIGDDNALYDHLIINCKLIEIVMNAWRDNETEQVEKKGSRRGYMGHLTNIALNIAELCAVTPLGQFLKDNTPSVADSFSIFNETILLEVKNTQEKLLGGANPNDVGEEGDDYGDVPCNQANALHQQLYTQYQVQQLVPQVMGFNYDDLYDPDLIDGNDTLQTIDQRTGMNFDLSEGDLVQQHELFKQICAQNINTLDDAHDQIFEERDQTYQTIIEKQPGSTKAVVYSSDSEEDDSPPFEDPFVTLDPWQTTTSNNDATWQKLQNDFVASATWENFTSFANFDENFDGYSFDNGFLKNPQKVEELGKCKDAELPDVSKLKLETQGESTPTQPLNVVVDEKTQVIATNLAVSDRTEAAVTDQEK